MSRSVWDPKWPRDASCRHIPSSLTLPTIPYCNFTPFLLAQTCLSPFPQPHFQRMPLFQFSRWSRKLSANTHQPCSFHLAAFTGQEWPRSPARSVPQPAPWAHSFSLRKGHGTSNSLFLSCFISSFFFPLFTKSFIILNLKNKLTSPWTPRSLVATVPFCCPTFPVKTLWKCCLSSVSPVLLRCVKDAHVDVLFNHFTKTTFDFQDPSNLHVIKFSDHFRIISLGLSVTLTQSIASSPLSPFLYLVSSIGQILTSLHPHWLLLLNLPRWFCFLILTS